MKTLLIVYHSQSGSTAALAASVAEGASGEPGVSVKLRRAFGACSDDLVQADGVLFGSPENFGYLSGGLTDFLARTFYPVLPRQLALPYAAFISAGNDGTGAIRQLDRIVSGYPLKKVAEPVIVRGPVDESGLDRCRELGEAMAAGLALGVF